MPPVGRQRWPCAAGGRFCAKELHVLASTRAHKRSRFVAATAVALLLCVLGHRPRPAAAANAGGTPARAARAAAGGSSTGGATGTSKRATARRRDQSPPLRTSPACASRASAACRAPSAAATRTRSRSTARCCSAGVGLKPGMVVAFPQAPGARISRVSPAARLRQTSSRACSSPSRAAPTPGTS